MIKESKSKLKTRSLAELLNAAERNSNVEVSIFSKHQYPSYLPDSPKIGRPLPVISFTF